MLADGNWKPFPVVLNAVMDAVPITKAKSYDDQHVKTHDKELAESIADGSAAIAKDTLRTKMFIIANNETHEPVGISGDDYNNLVIKLNPDYGKRDHSAALAKANERYNELWMDKVRRLSDEEIMDTSKKNRYARGKRVAHFMRPWLYPEVVELTFDHVQHGVPIVNSDGSYGYLIDFPNVANGVDMFTIIRVWPTMTGVNETVRYSSAQELVGAGWRLHKK